MSFPALFPTRDSLPHQPRMRNIPLDTYEIHLMRYHDNRFGSHPRFRYYLYNLIMHHQSQSTTTFFFKQSQNHNTPTTIQELCAHLKELPTDKLPEQVMCFGAHLRGTRSFWTMQRTEIIDMITQLQCPTLFFTLSAADTKWSYFHAIMHKEKPLDPILLLHWCTHNVIDHPHTIVAYMHKRFSIFHEEILQKQMYAIDYWYRYTLYNT